MDVCGRQLDILWRLTRSVVRFAPHKKSNRGRSLYLFRFDERTNADSLDCNH